MYRELADSDRLYIADRWIRDNKLEPLYKQLNRRDEAPRRAKRIRRWRCVAAVLALLFFAWVGNLMQSQREANDDSTALDYLRHASAKNGDQPLRSALKAADDYLNELWQDQQNQ